MRKATGCGEYSIPGDSRTAFTARTIFWQALIAKTPHIFYDLPNEFMFYNVDEDFQMDWMALYSGVFPFLRRNLALQSNGNHRKAERQTAYVARLRQFQVGYYEVPLLAEIVDWLERYRLACDWMIYQGLLVLYTRAVAKAHSKADNILEYYARHASPMPAPYGYTQLDDLVDGMVFQLRGWGMNAPTEWTSDCFTWHPLQQRRAEAKASIMQQFEARLDEHLEHTDRLALAFLSQVHELSEEDMVVSAYPGPALADNASELFPELTPDELAELAKTQQAHLDHERAIKTAIRRNVACKLAAMTDAEFTGARKLFTTPTKGEMSKHAEWLVDYQVNKMSWTAIANQEKEITQQAVKKAVREYASLIKLPLRETDPVGRPPKNTSEGPSIALGTRGRS